MKKVLLLLVFVLTALALTTEPNETIVEKVKPSNEYEQKHINDFDYMLDLENQRMSNIMMGCPCIQKTPCRKPCVIEEPDRS